MAARTSKPIVYGFLGAGQMGEAIFAGLLRKRVVHPRDIRIVDASAQRAEAMRLKHKLRVETSAQVLVDSCDVIVLAVKPQDLDALLQSLGSANLRGKLFLSIAAGKTLSWLEARLPKARVVRVMPNLAMRVGEGMSAFCLGSCATARDHRIATALLTSSGQARELPESLFDAVTALSGSGPAFLASILQAFVDGAVALGMPQEDALALAKQTLVGTAKVLAEGDESLAHFILAVTSAKGTTAAGLEVLQKSSLGSTIQRTLRAAARRSQALGKG